VNAEIQVLLVEDEASLRRSLEKYLERAGYTFECCSTAREALTLAERLAPDILIAEYHLPDANGVVLLEKLTRIVPKAVAILLSEYDFQTVAKDVALIPFGCFSRSLLTSLNWKQLCLPRARKRNWHWSIILKRNGNWPSKVCLSLYQNRELSDDIISKFKPASSGQRRLLIRVEALTPS